MDTLKQLQKGIITHTAALIEWRDELHILHSDLNKCDDVGNMKRIQRRINNVLRDKALSAGYVPSHQKARAKVQRQANALIKRIDKSLRRNGGVGGGYTYPSYSIAELKALLCNALAAEQ